jgi:hypothetical protein
MHVNASAKWNRLFAVIALCWAIVSPFLLAAEADRRPELARRDCTDTSYRLYGATDSPRFDVNRYTAEADACNRSYNSDSVRLPKVLSARELQGSRGREGPCVQPLNSSGLGVLDLPEYRLLRLA